MVLSLQVTMICCLPIFLPVTLVCLYICLRTSSLLEDVKRTRRNQKFKKYPENLKTKKKTTRKSGTCFEKQKNARVITIFFFQVKLNLLLKFIILIKTQANVLFLSVNKASPGIIAKIRRSMNLSIEDKKYVFTYRISNLFSEKYISFIKFELIFSEILAKMNKTIIILISKIFF